LFEQLVLLTAVLLGVTFIRAARRLDAGQRGYIVVVAGVLAVAVAAMARDSRFLGVVAMALAFVVVVAPWLLEAGARSMFARGKLRLAVWLAGLRAMLMPGAGLARQQEILRGLAVLERDGVDRALDHFRGLAGDTEDGGELAVINEQIVSMLLYGQRWDEGIAHYEARFHPRYAAMRPALALGLLRAYGESRQLDRAALLLRALEDGPVGNDPRALSLVSQARLTFLTYAGAATDVANALRDEGRCLLGLSAASGALFRGIAWLRAGEPGQAQVELLRVETLAGSADDRVVAASRRAIAGLRDSDDLAPLEIGDDLRDYVDAVARRLGSFVRAAPNMRRPGLLLVTPVFMALVIGGYLIVLGIDRGGVGLLVAGAMTPEHFLAGRWARLFTGVWVHGDPIGALLNLYTLWLTGPLFERVYGSARTVVAGLGGAALGLLVAAATASSPGTVLAGGNLLATAIAAGTFWILVPRPGSTMPSRARASLLIPLVLVLAAQGVSLLRGLLSLDVSWTGLLTAAGFGLLVAMIPPNAGRRLIAAVAIVLLALSGIATWLVARDDVERFMAATTRASVELEHAMIEVPSTFERTHEGAERQNVGRLELPVHKGVVDTVALRGGTLVELFTAVPVEDGEADDPALLLVDPSLRRELSVSDAEPPEAFARAYAEAGGEASTLRTFALRRNGVEVAITVERLLSDGSRIAILAAPPSGLSALPGLYASILAGADARSE
jgi:membrane associated rhomboid family serine protease